ncbi:MAG: two-component sensor histidine kinase [Pseudomonas sp.]|nr:two-component sensor histidine kinase [Pseudomonas sp.]
MSDTSAVPGETAVPATHELAQLDQQILEARAVLTVLEQQLVETHIRLGESLKIEQLTETNSQLMVALLEAQADAGTLPRSEHQRLNAELREANARLVMAALSAQGLQASAEHALGQQRNILALVAHELRNPLTPISMIASRLVRVPSTELPRMQALIEGQVQHMSRLVDDLLDVSRASTGKLRLDCREVDMLQIIHEAIDICTPVMNTRLLHFSARLPSCSLTMYGDPVRLTQILGNVLGNAAKYTPPGGIVELTVSADLDSLTVNVSDNGIGITAKALPFIFEPFIQDIHAIGFNAAGLGIGLTVVRELVEAHGGTVTGASDGDGKGSEFIITLPLLRR